MGCDVRLNWIAGVISLIGFGLLTSACATLPEVRYLSSALAVPANPTVTNAQGTLSARKSKSLLAGRWRNSHVDVAALAALEEAATGSPLIAGNKVTLLYDGPQTMAAMTAAISAASDHINLETYIFDQDALGIRFADLLIARQRAGVQVNIIYDSVGTIGTPQAFFDKMRDAAQRGVDVKIILPGVTDSGLMHYATQSFYDEMLAAGIKIYQMQIAVLHAKTAVIDRVWATVGSTNIDTRSFLHNNEINVVVLGGEFGAALENAFVEDLRYSVEITVEKWAQRSLGDRLKEWTARRLEYWL